MRGNAVAPLRELGQAVQHRAPRPPSQGVWKTQTRRLRLGETASVREIGNSSGGNAPDVTWNATHHPEGCYAAENADEEAEVCCAEERCGNEGDLHDFLPHGSARHAQPHSEISPGGHCPRTRTPSTHVRLHRERQQSCLHLGILPRSGQRLLAPSSSSEPEHSLVPLGGPQLSSSPLPRAGRPDSAAVSGP